MKRASLRMYPDLLSVSEVMEILRIGRVSVYKLIQTGNLKARKVAGKYRISKSALLLFFESFEEYGVICYNESNDTDELQLK